MVESTQQIVLRLIFNNLQTQNIVLSLTISVAQHCNRQLYFFNYSDGSSGNYHIGFVDYGVVQILWYLEIVSA